MLGIQFNFYNIQTPQQLHENPEFVTSIQFY
jgi:hypothetical protein